MIAETDPTPPPTTAEKAAHRARLAGTIRRTAEWRRQKADEPGLDKWDGVANRRASNALRYFANFVEALPDDDYDLMRCRWSRPTRDGTAYELGPETLRLLSRLWIARGATNGAPGTPTEAQLRNLLRRMDGAEQRHRREEDA